MKFIRHKEGIVHCDRVKGVSVEEIAPSQETGHKRKWAVCLQVDDLMKNGDDYRPDWSPDIVLKIVEYYKTIEEAEKELELFYQKLESPALPPDAPDLVKIGDLICDARLIRSICVCESAPARAGGARAFKESEIRTSIRVCLGGSSFDLYKEKTEAESRKIVKEIAEKLQIEDLCS